MCSLWVFWVSFFPFFAGFGGTSSLVALVVVGDLEHPRSILGPRPKFWFC